MKKINLFLGICCTLGIFACVSSPSQLHYSAEMVREKDHLQNHYDCYLSVTITNKSNKTISLHDRLKVYTYDNQGNQVTSSLSMYLDIANLGAGKHYTLRRYVSHGDNGDRICSSVSTFKFYL